MVDIPFTMSFTAPLARYNGPFSAGVPITIAWTGVTVNAPCGAYGYAVSWGFPDGSNAETRHSLPSAPGSISVTPTVAQAWIEISSYTDAFCSNGVLRGVTVSGGSIAYCQYGTSTQPSVTGGIIITTGLIDVLLTALALNPAWAIIFDTFVGATVYGGVLCNGLPPPFPTFTDDDFLAGVPNIVSSVSRDKWWTALQSALWFNVCQCNPGPPGSGDPLPPPLPTPTLPPAAPGGPVSLLCNEEDLCSTLDRMNRQLVAISGQIAQLRTDVTLIQRQKVPFAYLRGTVHGPLSGSGQFAVQGILGLSVDSTVIPPSLSASMAPVNSWFRLGELSFGTVDGWQRRQVITHDPHLVVDVGGDVTIVGYLFAQGVTAYITELVREP